MKNNPTIGFIGAGNMAYALISGLISNGFDAKNIKISDIDTTLLAKRQAEFKLKVCADNINLVSQCELVVLAVKPQVLAQVCQSLKGSLTHNQSILSIAAGIKITDIDRWLGGNRAIVRSMPNAPALIGKGITGAFANDKISKQQKSLVQKILSAVGETIWLTDEKMLDAVTALSGSGPAYFFLMLESMIKAGIALGLDEKTAQKLSIQTALGSGEMAANGINSPQVLRQKVSSANGTTYAAIESLQAQNFEAIVVHAIRMAFDRAREISNEFGSE